MKQLLLLLVFLPIELFAQREIDPALKNILERKWTFKFVTPEGDTGINQISSFKMWSKELYTATLRATAIEKGKKYTCSTAVSGRLYLGTNKNPIRLTFHEDYFTAKDGVPPNGWCLADGELHVFPDYNHPNKSYMLAKWNCRTDTVQVELAFRTEY